MGEPRVRPNPDSHKGHKGEHKVRPYGAKRGFAQGERAFLVGANLAFAQPGFARGRKGEHEVCPYGAKCRCAQRARANKRFAPRFQMQVARDTRANTRFAPTFSNTRKHFLPP
jgi:hypothetical protein